MGPALAGRDSIGSSCVVGDNRWAGTFGVQADFIAKSHCSVEYIAKDDILVRRPGTHPLRLSRRRSARSLCVHALYVVGVESSQVPRGRSKRLGYGEVECSRSCSRYKMLGHGSLTTSRRLPP